MKPWSMRARTQRERTQMNHRERLIALELLEDLAIPLEELQNYSFLSSSTDRDPGPKTSDSSINDLLIRPEFQSILSSNHPKTLTRHRPNRLSPEDIRLKDILKELTDSLIRQIDRLGNDVELLNWIDRRVFSQPSPSTLESSTEPTPSSNDILRDELGQAFKILDSDQALAALESKLNHKPCDPRTILDQPLCFTPLFSPILAHLLQIIPNRYMNPHLALYLFDWVRSHQHPLVKYFGLTRDVYLENLRIKWYAFRDVRGIKLDLLEMKSIGLGFDERFGKLIQAVTHAVLEDEVKAENRHSQWTKSDRHRSESLVDDDLDRFRKISTLERFHVSQIESILQDHIDSQNQAFSRRLRVPDHSNPTPV